jgi:hypothetical protein
MSEIARNIGEIFRKPLKHRSALLSALAFSSVLTGCVVNAQPRSAVTTLPEKRMASPKLMDENGNPTMVAPMEGSPEAHYFNAANESKTCRVLFMDENGNPTMVAPMEGSPEAVYFNGPRINECETVAEIR